MAGCTAGLASVLALHPLDVVKTRLQGVDSKAAMHGWGSTHGRCSKSKGIYALYEQVQQLFMLLQCRMVLPGCCLCTLAPGTRWPGSCRRRAGARSMPALPPRCWVQARAYSPSGLLHKHMHEPAQPQAS